MIENLIMALRYMRIVSENVMFRRWMLLESQTHRIYSDATSWMSDVKSLDFTILRLLLSLGIVIALICLMKSMLLDFWCGLGHYK